MAKALIDPEALEQIALLIEDAVAAGYARGVAASRRSIRAVRPHGDPARRTPDEVKEILHTQFGQPQSDTTTA